jgi:GNAT superfamily N-acetyltransferase
MPFINSGDVHLVTPDRALFERLLPVARRIFTEAFAKHYETIAFEAFCDAVYLPGRAMARDYAAPGVRWQVAVGDGAPIGYAKLTPLRAPAVDAAHGSLELQQIYVLSPWHGTGIADRLVEWAVNTACELGAPEIYLTVFDHNERAKRFYLRHGFAEVGRCTFQLGDRIEDDRIWRRLLSPRFSTQPNM